MSVPSIGERVRALIQGCLINSHHHDSALVVDGVVRKFIFDPAKIEENRAEIAAILDEMPLEFHKRGGGGWSFLNLPVDKNGHQWGEQPNAEELVALAIAANLGRYLLPRETWEALPGGMPYVQFDTGPTHAL